ncbi:carboxypeptidase 4 [Exophiala viscosa]|uniref:Carboxypeptidase n=1 Tax=Exophiala viscosa TaxID=2486360 RepID=A0AAN6IA34_9EURO|nr:carboxypeptidase 4 [Exophiala viscosa]
MYASFITITVTAILSLPAVVFALPHVARSAANDTSYQYLTNKTQPYAVDGANLPDIPFDIGESYAGLMPIDNDGGRELFFWFVPSRNPAASDEIVLWLNGGPGCSSLMGFLQENGPISWQAGQLAPMPNIYSWSNLTNVIWVEQPVGTGFSGAKGSGNATNEIDVAAQFLGFWKNFIDTFDMQGRKVSLTGESYAGNYVPYIGEAMLNKTGEEAQSYYDLNGILIYDPILGDRSLGTNAPVMDFIDANKNLFPMEDDFVDTLANLSAVCGFDDMMKQAYTFPPAGHIAVPEILDLVTIGSSSGFNTTVVECNLWDLVDEYMSELNSCFNVYYVGQACEYPGSVVGDPYHTNAPGSPEIYFARPDVQKAINAPENFNWSVCLPDGVEVFVNGFDLSDPSATNGGPLKTVIERTNNVIIGHGELDFVLMVNGSLLALQNLTWNGEQGLSDFPSKELFVPYYPQGVVAQSGNGTLGHWTESRGLTFSTVKLSGHEVPGYQPGAAYRHLEKLLGRIESLDEESDFSTAHLHW